VWRRVVGWFYLSEADIRDPSTHWTYLGICLFLLVTPIFLSSSGSDHVTVLGHRVPGACLSRELFHTTCPGCGLTRSFVALTHGRVRESLAFHRLGIALYLFFVWQAFYRLHCLHKRCKGISPRLLRFQSILALVMIAALIVNWGVGLSCGGN
jgi:hypothetical protein